jgi:predicted amidohydrolase YtcJ
LAYALHTAWANTHALWLANLLHDGDYGPNSEIIMAPDGLASGELPEPGAYRRIIDLLPQPDDNRKRALLHQELAQAAGFCITSIHNMDGDAERQGADHRQLGGGRALSRRAADQRGNANRSGWPVGHQWRRPATAAESMYAML